MFMRCDRRGFLHAAAGVAVSAWPAAAQKAAGGKALRLGLIIHTGKDLDAAVRRVYDLGFPTCQISVGNPDATNAKLLRAALDKYKIEATSLVAGGPPPEIYDFYQGPETIGLVPRKYREARIAKIKAVSDFGKMCGVPGVQTHCGFIPENPNDPLYKEAVEAIRTVTAYCKKNGQTFRCETGQESPVTLVRAMKDTGLDNIGVNLDPANLILYGKANPVEAVEILAPYIMGVHAKDGKYPTDPAKLGEEVPIGQGKVNFPVFIKRLKEIGYKGPLTIEREISGPKQTADIKASKIYLEKLIG